MGRQLDAMEYWPTPLARTCLLEGNRFWFYSLICSILWGLLQFFDVASESYDLAGTSIGKVDEKAAFESASEEETEARRISELTRENKMDTIKRKLVIDGFDLPSPGFVTGWFRTSASVVGFSSALSTVLSSKEIWDRLKE